jgi:hypothetical protein
MFQNAYRWRFPLSIYDQSVRLDQLETTMIDSFVTCVNIQSRDVRAQSKISMLSTAGSLCLEPCSSTRMMTKVSVTSTFTTIQGSGKVAFDCDVETTTIGDVKNRVENLAHVPAATQSIWWRGYILDDDSLPLLQACRGVNDGESIDADLEALTIFMTVPIEKRRPQSQPGCLKP